MTATVVRQDVARFVQDVRDALGDLAPDEVDDLTEGLVADVTDALGEADVATLGDPVEYAAELRSAAGLPPRAAATAVGGGPARPVHRHAADVVTGWLDRRPWWPATRDFLVVLRPVWWVIRGWALFQLLLPDGSALTFGRLLPTNPLALLVLIGFVVASVQLGRRSPRFDGQRRSAVVVLNVFVVLFLLVSLLTAATVRVDEGPYVSGPAPASGLWSNGEPVRDVYAYDAQGRLVPVIQLYDQDGRPLELSEDARSSNEDDGSTREAAPAVNADGRLLWNVFPLRAFRVTGPDDGMDSAVPTPVPSSVTPAPPFRSVAPVIAPAPSPTSSPAPSETPTPTATPSASGRPATTSPGVPPSAGPTSTPTP